MKSRSRATVLLLTIAFLAVAPFSRAIANATSASSAASSAECYVCDFVYTLYQDAQGNWHVTQHFCASVPYGGFNGCFGPMQPWLSCSHPPGPGGLCGAGGGDNPTPGEDVFAARTDGRRSLEAIKPTAKTSWLSRYSKYERNREDGHSSALACDGVIITRAYAPNTAKRLIAQSARIAL